MSKICEKCGALLSDDATFCTGCGLLLSQAITPIATVTPISPEIQQPQTASIVPVPSKDISQIFYLIGIGAIVIIIIALFSVFFGSSFKTPINNFYKGIQTHDWDKFSSAYPKEEFKYITKEDRNKLLDEWQSCYESAYGKNIKISIKFLGKEALDKVNIHDGFEVKTLSIKDFGDELNVKIEEAYMVECEVTVKGDNGSDTNTAYFNVGKIGSKWYLLDNVL